MLRLNADRALFACGLPSRPILQTAEAFAYHAGDHPMVDPAEFVRMAYRLRLKGEQTESDYAAVIVDEVQDISEIALRLLHSLVGDREDGLLLVGDATQRIFTRGYSLKGLGIDIAGRGLVLRKNYRNTKQILEAAFPLIEKEWKEDIAQAEIAISDLRPEFSVREGCRPIIVRCADEESEARFHGYSTCAKSRRAVVCVRTVA